MTERQIIDFNEANIKVGEPFKLLNTGWFKAVVKDFSTREIPSSGNFELTLKICPLDEHDEPVKQSVPYKIYIPYPNPHKAGHKAPNTFFGCWCFAKAIGLPIDNWPRKHPDLPGRFVDAKNNDIQEKEYYRLGDILKKEIAKLAVGWWNDPAQLKDEVLYIKIGHKKYDRKDGTPGIWAEAERVNSAIPDDEHARPLDEMFITLDEALEKVSIE